MMNYKIFVFVLLLSFSFSKLFSYSWPVYPYITQPRVNGTYMEVRPNSSRTDERDHMHAGIDLRAYENTDIAPVLDGYVELVVRTGDVPYVRLSDIYGNYFEYKHLKNIPGDLSQDDPVDEATTFLGETDNNHHLHFSDGVNASGYYLYEPLYYFTDYEFEDEVVPSIDYIKVVKDLNGTESDSYSIEDLYICF